MKASEAIAVGVHELNDRVRRLNCDHAPTSSCGWCKDRREAAKTLAALPRIVQAAIALGEAINIPGTTFPEEYVLNDIKSELLVLLYAYRDGAAALGLDPAPHGGGESTFDLQSGAAFKTPMPDEEQP